MVGDDVGCGIGGGEGDARLACSVDCLVVRGVGSRSGVGSVGGFFGEFV